MSTTCRSLPTQDNPTLPSSCTRFAAFSLIRKLSDPRMYQLGSDAAPAEWCRQQQPTTSAAPVPCAAPCIPRYSSVAATRLLLIHLCSSRVL